MGNMVAVTLMLPGVVIDAPAVSGAIDTSTSNVSTLLVEVPVAPPAEAGLATNETVVVFEALVTLVVPLHEHAPPLSAPNCGNKLALTLLFPVLIAKFSVTPVGMLLNVSRICELFTMSPPNPGPVAAWVSCVAVLQHAAQPSVIINDPKDLDIDPLVKMVAVPAPGLPVTPPMVVLPGARPTAKPLVAMPGPKELIIVPLDGEPSR
jgi:hypothetical protein